MNLKKIVVMSLASIFSFFGCKSDKCTYPQDVIATRSGENVTVTFFKHASLALEFNGLHIYVDPVDQYADYKQLTKSGTVVVCDKVSAEAFDYNCVTMLPGTSTKPYDGIEIKAVPAYNISEGHLDFHPKSREDCGYIVTLGESRFYIAGDTENNEDVKSLSDIDVAFLPVNQPYTMTVDQAVDVVKAIKPAIFYPYHYGEVEEKTDIDRLVRELEGVTEVRVRPME